MIFAAWHWLLINYLTVIISFSTALIIVLAVNLIFVLRRISQQIKRLRELFHIGSVVTLKRELLLPLNTVERGQSGIVQDVLDQPRFKVERQCFRQIVIVDFNGTLVPLDVNTARRYLILEEKNDG